MRTQQHYQSRHRSARSVAISVPQAQSEQLLVMVTGCLVAAIIALGMAELPAVTGYYSTDFKVVPHSATADPFPYTINHLNKGNHGVRFVDRWSAIEATGKSSNVPNRAEHFSSGCEIAFSRLVKAANLNARCLTAAAAAAPGLAVAE